MNFTLPNVSVVTNALQVEAAEDAAAAPLALQLAATAPSISARGGSERALAKGSSRAAAGAGSTGEEDDPEYWQDWGSNAVAIGSGSRGSGVVRLPGGEVLLRGEVTRRHPVFGDSDPLSDDLAKAVDTETLVQVRRGEGGEMFDGRMFDVALLESKC